MTVYVSHSSAFDYENELYRPLKESGIAAGHELFLPHDDANKDVPAREIIRNAGLVIAEVSYPSTGQGMELAWAADAGTPVICLHKAGSRPSGSLRFLELASNAYESREELIAFAYKIIKEMTP